MYRKRIRFSVEIEVDLDPVPGAWHQPEDHQNFVRHHFETAFRGYGGKVTFTCDPYEVAPVTK